MRAIKKLGTGGYHLEKAYANSPQTEKEATSRWAGFGYKQELLDRLLAEQFQLCCYSEIRADLLGIGYHIEHVEPKSGNPIRTFDYANLAASALHSCDDLPVFKAQGREVFGGHAKQSEYDPALFVSCHNPDCSRFFAYLSDGRIVAAEKLKEADVERAEYTIKLLNLNSPYLVTQRKNWWDELDQLFEQHRQKNWDLKHLAAVDLVPTNLKLNHFFSLTRQFYGRMAEQILKDHAPELA